MFNHKMFNKKFALSSTVAMLLVSQMSFAQTLSATKLQSNSQGAIKGSIAEPMKSRDAKRAPSKINERTLMFKGMNRTEVNAARAQAAKQVLLSSSKSQPVGNNVALHHNFAIYTGYSQLITDIDQDGYYQTFSVAFDADILSPMMYEQAVVYADLYLSRDGGPWVLYFSTDDFVITGQDTEDEFEVVTQLDSGYAPDHYDVLIELYEVGYQDVVATYSSDDSNEFYALPLESDDYDPEYIDVVYHEEHGGGSSWLFFTTLVMLAYRRFSS